MRKASEMERFQLRKDLKHGMSDDTQGPVFHFAQQRPADPPASGAGDGQRGGSALVAGLEREGEGASERLGALIADISNKERLAVEALRQAKGAQVVSAGGAQMSAGQSADGSMATDMRAVRQAFGGGGSWGGWGDGDEGNWGGGGGWGVGGGGWGGAGWGGGQGGRRRLLAHSWGMARWVEEAEHDLRDMPAPTVPWGTALAGGGGEGGGGGNRTEDDGNGSPGNAVSSDKAQGGGDMETDAQIERQIGDSYYLPAYFTAVVGHGLQAPGE